jgi:hypothetical protein
VDFVIERLGLGDVFRVVVTAEDVAAGKPAPDPYLAAATALGVPGDRCVVFEDTPVGIAAGHAAGARVVGLATTLPREAISAADRVIDDRRPGAAESSSAGVDGGRGRWPGPSPRCWRRSAAMASARQMSRYVHGRRAPEPTLATGAPGRRRS